jgi:hypothetical protein
VLGQRGGAAGSGEWRWRSSRAWAAWEVVERTGMQGPHVSDERERASRAECATQRGKCNPASVPKALGLNGFSDKALAYKVRRASVRRIGPARPDLGEISNGKTDFEFKLNSDFGKTLGNFYKEI